MVVRNSPGHNNVIYTSNLAIKADKYEMDRSWKTRFNE